MERGPAHRPWLRAGRLTALLTRPRVGRLTTERPLVSFTFDDVPDSAVSIGAPILEANGVGGTFYVASGWLGRGYGPWRFADRAAIPQLLDRGHEIGCHTRTHPDVQRLTPDALAAELNGNAAGLAAIDGRVSLRNFSYPYGGTGAVQKRAVAARFRSGRGTWPGLNAGSLDMAQLRAVRLYDRDFPAGRLASLLAETVRRRAWLVFYTHDVGSSPSDQGTSSGLFAEAVEASLRAGCDVVTVDQAINAAVDRAVAA